MRLRYLASRTLLSVALGVLLLFGRPTLAQRVYSVVYAFTGGTDGGNPRTGITHDADGNIYGTTYFGGDSRCNSPVGCGVVFKLDRFQTFSVIHSFSGGREGKYPFGNLALDAAGNLYGTTVKGGGSYGTVFSIDPSGTLATIHAFQFSDGAYPYSGAILDAKGNLYGTTTDGGEVGNGTVFKIDNSGNFSILLSFSGTALFPIGPLLADKDGQLLGTSKLSVSGDGTVFQADASGNLTVLHNFTGSDGGYPASGLVRDSSGNLYGTTEIGGDFGKGTVFKLDPTGTLTVLHSFSLNDGTLPLGGLILSGKGLLYGTTSQGGASGGGTVFKLDSVTGQFLVIHRFAGGTDGQFPSATLCTDADGALLGTTYGGGTYGYGTVFRITP